jgi:uncharacterized protein (TIGR02594 family)
MSTQRAMYELALGERGQMEVFGPKSNPRILGYIATVGGKLEDSKYAWCGAFIAYCAMKCDLPFRKVGLARAWLTWGDEIPINDAREGDLVILWRGTPKGVQGHIGFFRKWVRGQRVELFGGNQSNQVCDRVFPKVRILGVRRWTGAGG